MFRKSAVPCERLFNWLHC